MIASGGDRAALTKQLKRNFLRYQNIFQNFGITHEEINIRINKDQIVVEVSKAIFRELN